MRNPYEQLSGISGQSTTRMTSTNAENQQAGPLYKSSSRLGRLFTIRLPVASSRLIKKHSLLHDLYHQELDRMKGLLISEHTSHTKTSSLTSNNDDHRGYPQKDKPSVNLFGTPTGALLGINTNPLKRTSSGFINPTERLGARLGDESQPCGVSDTNFGSIIGVHYNNDSPFILPFASPSNSTKLFGRLWDHDLSPLARKTRGKRRWLSQDSVHERDAPSAEEVQSLSISLRSSCRSTHASSSSGAHLRRLSGVHLRSLSTILQGPKAKRRRLEDTRLPPSLLLVTDKTTPSVSDGASTLADDPSRTFVTTAEQMDTCSPPGHLSPVHDFFPLSLEDQLERARLKHLRKQRAAEARRNKHGGEGFLKMKARHRRRALRRANSEPSNPSRTRQDTPTLQAFPELLVPELNGAYHDWYRCESPEEISIYDTGEGEQAWEYLDNLPAIIVQPASNDAGGEVQREIRHPALCEADSPPGGAFDVRALANALQAISSLAPESKGQL
ncbi:hypothetical protein J3A83DRAFT_4189192 [Scleroderma citrinum]